MLRVSAVMEKMKDWQDGYFKLVAKVEEPVLKYTEKAADAVSEYVPERPDWEFLEDVPTFSEFVDSQLKFRKRLVDEQAAFVRKMMKAMHPALVKMETKAPATPRVRKPATRVVKAA